MKQHVNGSKQKKGQRSSISSSTNCREVQRQQTLVTNEMSQPHNTMILRRQVDDHFDAKNPAESSLNTTLEGF